MSLTPDGIALIQQWMNELMRQRQALLDQERMYHIFSQRIAILNQLHYEAAGKLYRVKR